MGRHQIYEERAEMEYSKDGGKVTAHVKNRCYYVKGRGKSVNCARVKESDVTMQRAGEHHCCCERLQIKGQRVELEDGKEGCPL